MTTNSKTAAPQPEQGFGEKWRRIPADEMRSLLVSVLDSVLTIEFGMKNAENKCWPTAHSWTKKERDRVVLQEAAAARKLLQEALS